MPRSFDISADCEGNVEAVLQAYSKEDYWLARLAASGVDDAKLESLRIGGESGNDGTIDVVTLQVIDSHKLPALITQIHRGDLCIKREETWSPVSGSVAMASVAGSIVVLGSLLGVGIVGKLENFIGTRLAALVVAEQRFTTEWIANNT